jgi:F-type H+-transporting ATPase subunit a
MSILKRLLISLFIVISAVQSGFAGESTHSEEFNAGELILHHISDAHDWHILGEVSIPLPVIVYEAGKGLSVFSSAKFHHGTEAYNGYMIEHEHIFAVGANGQKDESVHVYDFSITKNVASLFISVSLLLFVFLSIAAAYKKRGMAAPKGMQSFFEPLITYIRDEVAIPAIGQEKYRKFMPYLLTVFFFIWFNNLLGLMPAGANLTGNIAVTLMLALMTFIITTFSGNATYWKHILWTPGVPHLLKIIIVPIEIVGMFTKPFSLMVRLFANITAGHIIILSLISLVFILKNIFGMGGAAAGLAGVALAIAMSFLELFVALLQAFIFTLLSAMYFGAAVEEHHHDEHHAPDHH